LPNWVCGERLEADGIETSLGSRGESYDNPMAESMIGLYNHDET
jgi:hypothetical protein